MRTQIRKIGNSLGNIIPSSCIRELKLREGSELNVRLNGNQIIIEPIRPAVALTESDILQGLTPYTAHADELAAISPEELEGQ